jgi:hypothetical protein
MSRERIYCNSCKGETWHELVLSHEHDRYDYFWGFSQKFDSSVFKCCGCEDVTFILIKHPFEFQDEDDESQVYLYPDRAFKFRDRKAYLHLPKHVLKLYQETITAHNNELIILSTVGVRALVEAIVADKIPAANYRNNLKSKIDSLKEHFSDSVIGALHEFRNMGNKAAHELNPPESLNIHHALYVVENMLDYFYGIEGHAKLFRDHKK